jgi:hypothetical protein
MFGLKKEKTWGEYFQDFSMQYDIARVVIFQYLRFIFKENCKKEEFAMISGSNAYEMLAAQMEKYLLGMDYHEFAPGQTEQQQKIVVNYISQWADTIMKAHKEFADLVTDTLNMYGAYQGYAYHNKKGGVWAVETDEGRKIAGLLEKYIDKNRELPTPDSYSKSIKKWMRWSDSINDENYKSWFNFDTE